MPEPVRRSFSEGGCFLCLFVAKNPFNQCNQWLTNDLRLFKALYNCRDTSTTIEDSLQIRLFMQNKANFRKSQMNVNKVLTKDYGNIDTWWSGKTKPIKANQSQLKPIKSQNEPNTNPNKAKQTQFHTNFGGG